MGLAEPTDPSQVPSAPNMVQHYFCWPHRTALETEAEISILPTSSEAEIAVLPTLCISLYGNTLYTMCDSTDKYPAWGRRDKAVDCSALRAERPQLGPTCFSVLINILQHFPFGEAFSTAEVCSKQVVRVVLVFVWGSFTAELQLPCSSFQHIQKIETSSLLCRATDRHNKPSFQAAPVCMEFSPRGIFLVWAVWLFWLHSALRWQLWKLLTHMHNRLCLFFFSPAQLKAAFLSLDLWYLVFLSIKMLWEKTEKYINFPWAIYFSRKSVDAYVKAKQCKLLGHGNAVLARVLSKRELGKRDMETAWAQWL